MRVIDLKIQIVQSVFIELQKACREHGELNSSIIDKIQTAILTNYVKFGSDEDVVFTEKTLKTFEADSTLNPPDAICSKELNQCAVKRARPHQNRCSS